MVVNNVTSCPIAFSTCIMKVKMVMEKIGVRVFEEGMKGRLPDVLHADDLALHGESEKEIEGDGGTFC